MLWKNSSDSRSQVRLESPRVVSRKFNILTLSMSSRLPGGARGGDECLGGGDAKVDACTEHRGVQRGRTDKLNRRSGNSHAKILRYFRWQGLNATSHLLAPATQTSGEAALDAANRACADPLVMGGYGHARLRELFFGGFTRHVLKGVKLPAFVCH
jgi:hypothetical protein